MKRNLTLVLVLLIIVAISTGYLIGRAAGNAGLGVSLSFVLYFVAAGGFTYWHVIKPSRLEKQLLKSGELAEASINEVWETGLRLRGKKQIGLLLEVRPSGRSPFRAEAKTSIVPGLASSYQPGDVVQVRYDPTDTRLVAVEGPS